MVIYSLMILNMSRQNNYIHTSNDKLACSCSMEKTRRVTGSQKGLWHKFKLQRKLLKSNTLMKKDIVLSGLLTTVVAMALMQKMCLMHTK